MTAVAQGRTDADWETVRVTIRNGSPTDIAFFVNAAITAGQGRGEVVPIRYSRNDVSLFPGESTTITARFRRSELGGADAGVTLRGYNVPKRSVSVG